MTTTTPSFPETPRPKVSVCVVTYNQEKYIAQCLQSLVDQETDFPFEVIVSDDCSTDGTSDIVLDFANRYPNIVRAFIQSNNIGPFGNYRFIHGEASGRLIAHVDGDDYALPGKLSRQVAFMENNPSCRISGHDVYHLGDDGDLHLHKKDIPSVSSAEMFLKCGNFLTHSSTMYRAEFLLSKSIDPEAIDFQMHVDRVGGGCVGYMSEVLGVYRLASGGMVSRYYQSTKMFYKNVSAIRSVEGGSAYLIGDAIYKLAFNWIKNFVAVGRYALAMEIFMFHDVGMLPMQRRFKLGLLIALGPVVYVALKISRKKLW